MLFEFILFLCLTFNYKEERRCGRINYLKLRDTQLEAGYLAELFVEEVSFHGTLVVSGINGNDQTTVAFEQFDSGFNGGNRSFVKRCDGFITTG